MEEWSRGGKILREQFQIETPPPLAAVEDLPVVPVQTFPDHPDGPSRTFTTDD